MGKYLPTHPDGRVTSVSHLLIEASSRLSAVRLEPDKLKIVNHYKLGPLAGLDVRQY
jgi:hypothetical protein